MSFFNLYNKSQSYLYRKSLKVGNSVFALGEILLEGSDDPKTIITKLNINGEVLWERSYNFDAGSTGIEDAQMVECTNGDILIMGPMAYNAKASYLGRVKSSDGSIIWQKSFKDNVAYIENGMLHLGNEIYIIALWNITVGESETGQKVVLVKINGNGNVIAKKTIEYPVGYLFSCNGIAKGNSKIGLYGGYISETDGIQHKEALILEVDFNLTQITGKITSTETIGPVNYLIYKANSFYAFRLSMQNGAFINKCTPNYPAGTILANSQRVFGTKVTTLKHNDQHIYLENNTKYNSEISKLPYDLSIPLWTKRIIHDGTNGSKRGILSYATNNELGLIETTVSNYGNYALAKLDLELNSCKTQTAETVLLGDKYSVFVFEDLPYTLVDIELLFYTIEAPVIGNIISERVEVCPTELEPTCEKNEEICKIYNDLVKIMDSCLPNPELLPENPDYKRLVKCLAEFMEKIKYFLDKFPQFQLDVLFNAQFIAINDFQKDPTLSNYVAAWNSLQQIVMYISSLGNCNCENTIKIDENTWLQSPNFYLQAAGSQGSDSAKGIHLRWIFSGILGENHLPKGNLALPSSTTIFNKPNDFVKIHRAEYKPYVFTLSFSTPPQSVNDAQQYWLYKFNNDTRIFFVYFRNAAKYNQVRLTNDPFTHPLEFIKNYGNELIEVENKRELFFAADLITNLYGIGNTLQLESLSVKENTVFTPKYLSFRKSYDSNELGERVRLICENGRSVRFKGFNCMVMKIDFEFYSDFITNTANKGDWKFKDNYALTLLDNEAITRLDPIPEVNPVHGKWLRYNDQAYVNCENYIHKWNAPVTNSFDRNCKDIVNSYITLSNEEDNPTATEFIDFNLSYQTDPDEPIEPAELTEVNNLDLLRIMSTDFHIARMLGLGTLDIKEEVFDREFVYLASYTTYGGLGEGSETVHHLSMSLPTTIKTERLPLPLEIDYLQAGFVGVSDNADDDYINTHDGYSFDGKNRFVSIVTKDVMEFNPNPPFYETNVDIDLSTFTLPTYGGIESRKMLSGQEDPHVWEKPELSNDPEYTNVDEFPGSYETIPMLIPDPGNSLYVDIQTKTGTYFYATYGINWFSRATSDPNELEIKTTLKPFNSLQPPSNILPHLIRTEFPLMFTSQNEQTRYSTNPDQDDKTLVRLQFDYNSDHELISYQIPETDDPGQYVTDTYSLFPDNEEVWGEHFEIYFRNSLPKRIAAKAVGDPQPVSLFLTRIYTENYTLLSTATENNPPEVLLSQFPAGTTAANFIGGVFAMGEQKFIINAIEQGPNGLNFIVFNQQLGDGLVDNEIPELDAQAMTLPVITDGLFMAVENMQNLICWGQLNPHVFTPVIGNGNWPVHRELLQSLSESGAVEYYIEKTRGFWETAIISKVYENSVVYPPVILPATESEHRGIYKITFPGFHLPIHPQSYENENSVEWFNGTVRLFTQSNIIDDEIHDSRKTFNVFKTENIGPGGGDLVLYINDPDFTLDPDLTNDLILNSDGATPVLVNYYPSYKVYLYHDEGHNLTEPKILPAEGEGTHYSIFSMRTVDQDYSDENGLYRSRYSLPAPMMAQEIIEAKPPLLPKGAKYATRPDFYGKSTYTITTQYDNHKPYGVFYYRGDNQGLLAALYSKARIEEIKNSLKELGGNEELFFTNRWENFMDFGTDNAYTAYPPDLPEQYALPLPNKKAFFDDINRFIQFHNQRFNLSVDEIPETAYGHIGLNDEVIEASAHNSSIPLSDFIKEAIMNAFVPLTEVPVLYQYIKNSPYKPINKKQVIRDKDGYLIKPPINVNNPAEITEFDMAPMMKNVSVGNDYKIQFTDFTIDGTSDNFYFYAAKEMSSLLKMSDFSPVLGPIKIVNSSPPEAPKVKSMLPILENRILGTTPEIDFEIAAYPKIQNIKKINLYRTFNRLEASSVQSMELIKVIDVDVENLADEAIWTIKDDFSSLPEVPYGDALFYRLTISRKIEYAEALYDQSDAPSIIIDYAPSQPSKVIASMIMENYAPPSPVVDYYSEELNPAATELQFITLHWNETAYKANYRLYKLNSNGNWIEIARVMADRAINNQYHYFNTNHPTSTDDWTEEAIIDSINGEIYIQLEMTNLNNPNLIVLSADNTKIHHHFKVVAENTAGMLSKEENILTLYNEVTWTDIGGIALPDHTHGMIVGPTFRVR